MSAKISKNSAEEVIQGFNKLRIEQRQLAQKVAELEQELNEHRMVIETLTGVDPSRKCFRMIGGVLVERTVREVLPALTTNRDQLTQLIDQLKEQVLKKAQDIAAYQEKHQIQIRGPGGQGPPPAGDERPAAARAAGAAGATGGGVLVSQGQS
ncbi:Prefoldin subunit 2 [Amphibalanus amphitrite]|uniref:Prefoldin subunit 2 n=1 Tax=Amphibalanus amphitrite TaxID=1232801 RepID=A0A6A4WQK1_AMPAM|nr:prefoldin subunit 2-like [Amphibalanus amphitrite]XP_043233036.1 prefoldin subunit 2-like [Amphibalanus amphitrite]XP_043233044.1 prefoldin subunit 2-like [Amphibalanus amphitrite]XP_043233052.1 prefoldin subunit 2-like [Amphibalanus amphitrite]KAF0304358.1 Prefoldin subunit 2 [Amphibalanus amphitrite]